MDCFFTASLFQRQQKRYFFFTFIQIILIHYCLVKYNNTKKVKFEHRFFPLSLKAVIKYAVFSFFFMQNIIFYENKLRLIKKNDRFFPLSLKAVFMIFSLFLTQNLVICKNNQKKSKKN
jgi:hypothetical protein